MNPDVPDGRTAPVTQRRKRRGATAIEYAFCASLILVGCVIGVQHLSSVLKKSTGDTAATLKKANPAK